MDRIDIHIDVPAVNYKEMRSTNEPESSAKIRERVMRARAEATAAFRHVPRKALLQRPDVFPPHPQSSASSRPIASGCSNAP